MAARNKVTILMILFSLCLLLGLCALVAQGNRCFQNAGSQVKNVPAKSNLP
jgi:hypothetical protein